MRFFHLYPTVSLLFTVTANPLPIRSSPTDLNVHSVLYRRATDDPPTRKSPRLNPPETPPTRKSPRLNPTNAPTVLGVCAMDEKARSKAMSEILAGMEKAHGSLEVKIFGDQVILHEAVEKWPKCDVLISFFSKGFPLEKAISYVNLRNPFCVNELPPQALLKDRRLVGAVLDHLKVPTPPRLEASRDGGPKVDNSVREYMRQKIGVVLAGQKCAQPKVTLRKDGDAIKINGKVLEKPFVEKPVDGDDHNVYIYHKGGGGRRLFRKVGDKSSELDPTLNHPRKDGSYIYEKYLPSEHSQDIKVYTVGKKYALAETRKSPAVDGNVERNGKGKEIRTPLSKKEKVWAGKICDGFGQAVCGYDMLRSQCENGAQSSVIDVNGWSFVKGHPIYTENASKNLANLCVQHSKSSTPSSSAPSSSGGRKRPRPT